MARNSRSTFDLLALPRAALLLAASLWFPAQAPAQGYDPILARDPTREVGLDQRLGEMLPLDLVFRDGTGAEVRLGDYFGHGPVVLALVYYECPMLCTLVLNGAVRTLRGVPLDAGEDFEVVVVSIDPGETPELAAAKQAEYVKAYDRPGGEDGWHLLVGDEPQIQELARAIGYRYVYDEASGEYAHAGGMLVATSEGELSHYFYGVEFVPRDVRLALVESGDGKIGTLVDQVLMLCMHYDPTTGKYGLAIMNSLRALGALTVGAIAVFVLSMLRRERRLASSQPTHAGGRA